MMLELMLGTPNVLKSLLLKLILMIIQMTWSTEAVVAGHQGQLGFILDFEIIVPSNVFLCCAHTGIWDRNMVKEKRYLWFLQ